jgi:hypothetical protein
MPNDKNGAVGGLTETEMEQIRKLKGHIQAQMTQESISNRDAVMWAVNNELEKFNDE